MADLTETEKEIVALSLFGYVMRAGPGQFVRTGIIAEKLGVTKELEYYALDWIATPKAGPLPPPTSRETKNEAEATVKFAIFNGIVTQWHLKDEERFAFIVRDSVFRELFTFHKGTVRELLETL